MLQMQKDKDLHLRFNSQMNNFTFLPRLFDTIRITAFVLRLYEFNHTALQSNR